MSTIGSLVGTAGGYAVGGPAGAKIGGTIGGMIGGGGNSAKKAAAAQLDFAKKAMYAQQAAQIQAREDLSPWMTTGGSASSKLADLLGLQGGSIKPQGDLAFDIAKKYLPSTASLYDQDNVYGNGQYSDSTTKKYYKIDPVTGYIMEKDANKAHTGDTSWRPYAGQGYSADSLKNEIQSAYDGQAEPEGYGSLLDNFDADKFQTEPGYEFRLNEGQKAVDHGNAARGNFLSGAAIKASAKYNQDFASNEYGNAYNRYTTDQNNTFGRLMGVSNQGLGASQSLAGMNQNTANSVGNLYGDMGNASAAGIVGNQNEQNQKTATLADLFGSFGGFGQTQYGGGTSYYPKTNTTVRWN